MKKITIAIDGFSSCGKSTMAKSLAKKLDYIYIDTGAMYRAVSLYCLEAGFVDNGVVDQESLKLVLEHIKISFKKDENGNNITLLNDVDVDDEIRTMRVSNLVSTVSAIPFVREKLVNMQRAFGSEGGVVLDGRDIGSFVFPKAEFKLFIKADANIRAKRRFDELSAKGQDVKYDEILENIQKRDYMDTHRDISPLKQAQDAIVLDNGNMTIEEQNEWLIEKVNNIIRS